MVMTIAITRNLPDRFGGFIGSCMHELAPGVYVAPKMKKSVRERLWKVMMEWSELIPDDGGIVLFWRSPEAPSNLAVRVLGWPKKELVEYEGMWLTHRNLTEYHNIGELKEMSDLKEPEFSEEDPSIQDF